MVTGLPAIGVGKTPLIGTWDPPATERGAWSPLRDGGEVLGRVLRTRDGVKPVFVSVGHRMSLENATAQVLALTRGTDCRRPPAPPTASAATPSPAQSTRT